MVRIGTNPGSDAPRKEGNGGAPCWYNGSLSGGLKNERKLTTRHSNNNVDKQASNAFLLSFVNFDLCAVLRACLGFFTRQKPPNVLL